MEYKIGSENEVHTRQKFHARTRLLKALKCARILVDIANESSRVSERFICCNYWSTIKLFKVDSLTKSQTKSYATYIAGFHTLAKNNWAGDNASQLVDEIMQLELSDGRSAETDSAPPISKAAEQRAAETKEKKERKVKRLEGARCSHFSIANFSVGCFCTAAARARFAAARLFRSCA